MRTAFISLMMVLLLGFGSARAAVSFVFNYNDLGMGGSPGSGTGFDDPVDGERRRTALQLAADIFGQSVLGAYNAVITFNVSSMSSGLASAGSQFVDAFAGGGFGRAEVIRNKILSNNAIDLNGGFVDGALNVNFDLLPYEYDVNATPGNGTIDFFAVMWHEFSHAIGWGASVQQDGSDLFGNGLNSPGEWSQYDQFLTDSQGEPVIDRMTLLNGLGAEYLNRASGEDGGLFFGGPNAIAANGGLVPLYTPNPFEPGSSVSHLDSDNPLFAGLLMLPSISTGLGPRVYSAVELGILRDLGYDDIVQIDISVITTEVPVPGALLLMASGLVGFRWRSKKASPKVDLAV
ncbi:MAG: hypothetical protein V3V30_10025 [Parvularculaceae bacterium]